MTILLFLFGVAVAAGLFFILADILKLPRLSTEKALLSAGRAEKKRMKSLDAIFLGWAIKISHFIRMDEYMRHRMERTLSAAGMDMTPEVYLAYTILKPAAALLAVIPCLLIFPLLSPIVVLLSILLYFKESRKAEEKVTERREKIEGELPRFVATVEQELGASRDVLTILENYKRHAGPDFARELDVHGGYAPPLTKRHWFASRAGWRRPCSRTSCECSSASCAAMTGASIFRCSPTI